VLDATSIQAVTAGWKINPHDQTTGLDRGYLGPVRKQWLALKPTGRLVAWDPAAQREAWHVDLPDPGSGGTLSTAGNLVFRDAPTENCAPIARPTASCFGNSTQESESWRRR
jgi:hypothetical protein